MTYPEMRYGAVKFIYSKPGSVRCRNRSRRCAKCGEPNSPTWRLGPDGETLCNKCGLQYRRGFGRGPPVRKSSPCAGILGASTSHQPSSNTTSDSTEVIGIDSRNTEGTNSESGSNTIQIRDGEQDSSLNINRQGHPNSDYGSELNPNLGNSESGWVIMEGTSSYIPPDLSPDLGVITYNDASHPLLPAQPEADGLGFSPARDADAANHVFGSVQQDNQIVDTADLSRSQEQATETEHYSNTWISLPPSHPMYSPASGLPSNGSISSLLEFSSSSSEVPPAVSYVSSLFGVCGSAVLEYRQREAAHHTALISAPISHFSGIQLRSAQEPGIQTTSGSSQQTTGTDYNSHGADHEVRCTCSRCLHALFIGEDEMISRDPQYYLEIPLNGFYTRVAAVHHAALRRNSSIYVATETSIREFAGDNFFVTAIALLQQNLELVSSSSSNRPPLIAAGWDLKFDYVVSGTTTHSIPLDDWLHGQSIVKYVNSERAKSAIWDISRLPPGRHIPDSQTFRWLQRTLLTIETSSGPQVVMNVQSGNDDHQFRRLHGELALIKHVNTPNRLELYSALEPRLQDACIESCQVWYIAVLDEVAKLPSGESQLQFLQANCKCMSDCLEVYMSAFHQMGIDRCLHICSCNCTSHVQPSFQSLVTAARNSLQILFSSPETLLASIHEMPDKYPTQDHLFHTRVLGLTQLKLYFSYALMPKEKKAEHSNYSRLGLANARLELAETIQGGLVWNYLPVDISRHAASKLARATTACELFRDRYMEPFSDVAQRAVGSSGTLSVC